MSISPGKIFLTVIFLATISIIVGCGKDQPTQQVSATKVKVMKVIQMDAPISYEYSGQIIGKGEVKVQSKIAGKIVEKYIRGGQNVTEGQALYKIDSRQYDIAILQAQAQLAKAQTNLDNALTELNRDEMLFEEGAIAEQVLTNQRATCNALRADVDANEAALIKAQEDLVDTIVYAPMSGRLAIDDVAVGTYVNPGNTNLVTIGAVDPIFVQFSISETEYLKFMSADSRQRQQEEAEQRSNQGSRPVITLTLADDTDYPYDGRFAEVDRSLDSNTGTLTFRALFDNPDNILKPGMFARIIIKGITIPNAILVPERAIQQLLGESFVLVANSENKSEVRTVKLGEKIGSYYVVTEGLKPNDLVVVEGLTRLRDNMPIEFSVVTPDDMGFSIQSKDKLFDTDK
ncbi:MAG: efflux RND transporter periplasmic adaptor subunit [Selenomonadaceae bacterium]|nr:efflux RND transporter periplasmic adaptor subunit [Selenomonadaceae bacterium]